MNCFWPQAVLYEMNVRQLTPEGTLRAATSKLPFLKDLGVDAVWLMPVYPIGEAGRKGSLGSYYSIRDYCAVNPELGTMADFDAFVAEAHCLGMRVLLDWVANHTARDARWIAEKPASWYERDAAGRPAVPWDWSDTAKPTTPTATCGARRPTPWSSGSRSTTSTDSAATWRCWFPSSSGTRPRCACGV